MSVYFIRPVGFAGPIKIGCSENPEDRRRALERLGPFDLELAAVIPGSFDLERNIHHCFADLYIRAEWFKPDPRLVAAVELLAAGVPVQEAIDLSDVRGKINRGTMSRTPEALERVQWWGRINGRVNGWQKRLKRQLLVPNRIDFLMRRWSRHDVRPSPSEFAELTAFLQGMPDTLQTYAEKYNSEPAKKAA